MKRDKENNENEMENKPPRLRAVRVLIEFKAETNSFGILEVILQAVKGKEKEK